jgi:HPt (histidine-containing phosphotransfer) domain-containing protein
MRDAAEACAAAGMDDLLVKPADLRTLKNKLRQFLPSPSNGGENAKYGDVAEPSPPPPPTGQVSPVALAHLVLDPSVLRELSDGDSDMEAGILRRFPMTNQPVTEALIRAVAEHDAEAVSQLAHRIKGAARMIGAGEYAQACEILEQAGKSRDWAIIETGLAQFKTALARLEQALS